VPAGVSGPTVASFRSHMPRTPINDLPHPAAAVERDDFVSAEASAGSEGHPGMSESANYTGRRLRHGDFAAAMLQGRLI
jgi:hypothetical protein